jgi:SAM-dependent methyltransferase
MLAVAASRGIRTYEGHAEALPFRDESFDGVLLALTLCFVADAEQTMEECRRALRPKGRLVLGFIPADSAWGRACQAKGAEGHPVYAYARFRTASETVALAENTGFTLRDAASTLFWEPGATPEVEPRIEPGVAPGAGFIGLLFTKARPGPPGSHGWD